MASVFDCVVVGAGIEGSCTAMQLARAGKRTLLIEQYEQSHARGSSHGGSRITRQAYKEPYFASLMPAAHEAWKALETETGKQLLVWTPMVNVSTRAPHKDVDEMATTMTSLNLPYEVMDGPALHQRWPSLNYPDTAKALVDPTAGIIKADIALRAIQDLFVKFGGETQWGIKVKKITPGTDTVTIKTTAGNVLAQSVVLCAGPWTSQLTIPLGLDLPLKPQAVSVYYWPESVPGSYSAPRHPTLFDFDTYEYEVFAMPAMEFPGLAKLCYHHGPFVDPDNPPTSIDQHAQECLQKYIQKHIPALVLTAPYNMYNCFYTMTPEGAFILDKHPQHKNIIIGAGFSGTGFKLGPIVGNILSSLAMDQTPSYDISAFKIGRFS